MAVSGANSNFLAGGEAQKTVVVETQVELSKNVKSPVETAENTFYVKHQHIRPADFLSVANLACNVCIVALMLLTLIYGGKP
jgi:hypothetical protein